MSAKISPAEDRAWRSLLKQWGRGAGAQAIELARQHTTEYPTRPAPWLVLADCLISFSLWEEALAALRAAERRLPQRKRHLAWARRGELARERGNLKLAEAWFRRVVEAEPGNAGNLIALGALLAKRGDFAGAKRAHRRAAKLGTGATEEAYLNLGLILRAERRYPEALACLQRALEIDPGYTDAKVAVRDVERASRLAGSARGAKRGGPRSRHG